MADDDEEDLYDDEFDFVDDDDDESEVDEIDEANEVDEEDRKPEVAKREPPARDRDDDRDLNGDVDREPEIDAEESPLEDYGPPAPAANYVVHIYEYKEFKRTIDRPFTPEDAEAFASEYNRTAKPYGRFALTGKDDAKPKKELD